MPLLLLALRRRPPTVCAIIITILCSAFPFVLFITSCRPLPPPPPHGPCPGAIRVLPITFHQAVVRRPRFVPSPPRPVPSSFADCASHIAAWCRCIEPERLHLPLDPISYGSTRMALVLRTSSEAHRGGTALLWRCFPDGRASPSSRGGSRPSFGIPPGS